jgi:hypothetical protein
LALQAKLCKLFLRRCHGFDWTAVRRFRAPTPARQRDPANKETRRIRR